MKWILDRMNQNAPGAPTYWLTRFMILRLLGFIYAIAFLVAINQILPLIGADGLTPVGLYLTHISQALGGNGARFMRLPSLFWLGHSDGALLTLAWMGFLLSLVVVAGYANALMLFVLWIVWLPSLSANDPQLIEFLNSQGWLK